MTEARKFPWRPTNDRCNSEKHGKSIEELRQEREKRLWDAVELKVPDRVPVIFGGTFFACKYAGILTRLPIMILSHGKNAFKKMIVDMDPDSYGWEQEIRCGARSP